MKLSIFDITFLMGIIFLFASCNSSNWYQDDFYNHDSEDAYDRLPLIKPYKLIKKGSGWLVNFIDTTKIECPVDNFYIDTTGGAIAGYGSRGTYWIRGKEEEFKHILYFIIEYKKKKEISFSIDSIRFKKELKSLNIQDSLFYTEKEILELHKVYSKTGKLPWYP